MQLIKPHSWGNNTYWYYYPYLTMVGVNTRDDDNDNHFHHVDEFYTGGKPIKYYLKEITI